MPVAGRSPTWPTSPRDATLAVGIGGEDRDEITACGIDPATRGARTNESLIVLRRLLTRSGQFRRIHITLDNTLIRPAPSTPVPLIVAGRSAAAQTRAALLGDGWLGIWTSPSRYAEATASIAEQASPQAVTRPSSTTASTSGAVWPPTANTPRTPSPPR